MGLVSLWDVSIGIIIKNRKKLHDFVSAKNIKDYLKWIGLSVQVKRWHDRGKSGWWGLINLIPIIGQVWVFIECGVLRSTAGDNRFGRDSVSSSQ